MKYTNRKGLPDIIVKAVENDPYNAGDTDYSATTLLKPSWMVMLQKKHADELTEDVCDRLWSMYGSAAHHIVERATTKTYDITGRVGKNGPLREAVIWAAKQAGKAFKFLRITVEFIAKADEMVETRYFATIKGKKISAQIDHGNKIDGVLSDWKLTAAYKIQKALEKPDDDWTRQLNIQAYLVKFNGGIVNELRIGAMCRDWRKFDHKTKPGYPDQIEYIKLPLWTQEEQLEYIESRIDAMENPVPCTQEERWQDDPVYALMKDGGTRALKTGSSEEEILEYCETKGWTIIPDKPAECVSDLIKDGYSIEKREARNRRCEDYCNVNLFCDYYKSMYADASDLPFKDAS